MFHKLINFFAELPRIREAQMNGTHRSDHFWRIVDHIWRKLLVFLQVEELAVAISLNCGDRTCAREMRAERKKRDNSTRLQVGGAAIGHSLDRSLQVIVEKGGRLP